MSVLHALRKGGGIAIAFVLVCLLSRCYVARVGRLLQHGVIRQGIVVSEDVRRHYPADNWQHEGWCRSDASV